MSNKLHDTLLKFKPDSDQLWTEDGLPRLDVLSNAMGEEITRERLNKEFPGFSRATAAEFGEKAVQDAASGQAPAAPAAPDVPPAPTVEGQDSAAQDVPAVESRQDVLARLTQEVGDAIQAVADSKVRLDRAKEALAKASEQPKTDDADMIQKYLASQQRAREERAALARTVSDAGLNLQALQAALSPAPVDAARQQRRPVVPVQNPQ